MEANDLDKHRQEAEDAALFAMAMQAVRENDDEDFEAFLNSEEYVEPDAKKFEAFGKELEKRYRRTLQKHHPIHRRFTWKTSVAFAAALIIVVFSATVCAAHFGFLNWFSIDHPLYSSIWPDEGKRLEKPEGWDSPYYPTWMVKGYTLSAVSSLNSIKCLTYSSDGDSNNIVFTVRQGTTWQFPNTEGMEKAVIKICGEDNILYRTSDGRRGVLVIRVSDAILVIDGPIIDEDFVKIAENIHGL